MNIMNNNTYNSENDNNHDSDYIDGKIEIER